MTKSNMTLQEEKDKTLSSLVAKQKELSVLEADFSGLIKEKYDEARRVETVLAGKYKRYLAEHPFDRTQEPEINRFITSKTQELKISSEKYERTCNSEVASMQRVSAPSIRSPLLTPYKESIRRAVKLYIGDLKQLLDEVLLATDRFYKNGISKENMDRLLLLMDSIWCSGEIVSFSIDSVIIAKGSFPSRYKQKIEKWRNINVPEDIEAADNRRIKEASHSARSRLDAAKAEASSLELSFKQIEADLTQEINHSTELNAELIKANNSYQTDRDKIIENTMSRLQKLAEANLELQAKEIELSNDLNVMYLDLRYTFFLCIKKRKVLKALIRDIEAELTNVQTKTQALHTALDNEKNACHSQLDLLDKSIISLESQLSESNSTIAFLTNTRIDTIRKIAVLSRQLPVLQRAVDDARSDYLIQTYGDKKVLSSIDNVQKRIDNVVSSILELEKNIEIIESKMKAPIEDSTSQSRTTSSFKKNKSSETVNKRGLKPIRDVRISEIDAFRLKESILSTRTLSSEGTKTKRRPTLGKPVIAAIVVVLCVLQSMVVIHFVMVNKDHVQAQRVEDSILLSAQEESLDKSGHNISDYESWLKDGSSDVFSEQAEETTEANSTRSGYSYTSIEYTWPDGTRYAGGYKDGQANGYGEMTFPDKGIYKGNFVDGMRSGFGTFSWENGDNYSGNWKDDAMDGQGIYTFADGYVMKGTWNKNLFIGGTSDEILPPEKPVEQIQLNYGDYVLELNDTFTLAATVSPENATYQSLTWASSDPSVANVTSSGVVTAYSAGETIISASSDNGVTASCFIKVYQEITSIWDGNWAIAATDSYGSYEGTNYGTCTISTETMTVSVDGGSPIALTASDESTLMGTTASGAYTGELCFTSLTEYQILLELNWVYTAIGYDDVITTDYFLLTRMEG